MSVRGLVVMCVLLALQCQAMPADETKVSQETIDLLKPHKQELLDDLSCQCLDGLSKFITDFASITGAAPQEAIDALDQVKQALSDKTITATQKLMVDQTIKQLSKTLVKFINENL